MYHLTEKYAVLGALAPQSIAAAGVATGNFADMQSRKCFCFTVLTGAVAAGKAVKVELLASAAAAGTDAVPVGEAVFTAPAGGVESHVVNVVGQVSPLRGRYLAVRVTNSGAAALLASATLVADSACYPEETGGTTLVV